MLKESLRVWVLDGDGNKVAFPNNKEQAILSNWQYTAERMAGAPTITDSIMHTQCLDDLWTKKEFVELNGERYYISQVPTSEKDTDDIRYEHKVTFVSERSILENVFFFDCVTRDEGMQANDKPRSNTTDFSFYGTLTELVERLNDSLSYSHLYDAEGVNGFRIVIDNGVAVTEAKEVSITDAYFATAMQEIYNVFEVPYYWVGNVCHVGYQENEITEPFEYGANKGLLSVTKENSDFRIINRITGMGSADNLPYYYPNDDPNGTAIFTTQNFSRELVDSISLAELFKHTTDIYGLTLTLCRNTKESYEANLLNYDNYKTKQVDGGLKQKVNIKLDGVDSKLPATINGLTWDFFLGKVEYTYETDRGSMGSKTITTNYRVLSIFEFTTTNNTTRIDFGDINFVANAIKAYKDNKDKTATSTSLPSLNFSYNYCYYIGEGYSKEEVESLITDTTILNNRFAFGDSLPGLISYNNSADKYRDCVKGKHSILIDCKISCDIDTSKDLFVNIQASPKGSLKLINNVGEQNFVAFPSGKTIYLSESGIKISNIESLPLALVDYTYDGRNWITTDLSSVSSNAAKIIISGRDYISPMSKLMPYIYRKSKGSDRFYNAINDEYQIDGEEGKHVFNNPYIQGEPLEGKQDFDDIKPTINGITNAQGQLFGEVADIAFDDTDSDDLATKEGSTSSAELVHSYFYIKLHKFDGDYGFNLFKQGLSKGAMTLNFISGSCAGCAFEVGVSEGRQVGNHYEFDNPVQVDESGNVVPGDFEAKVKEGNIIESQQDTSTNSVWIALKKDQSTFGVVMPNATNNYRPKTGDKFVITNILLPKAYITAAEKRLEAALIKYMSENNDEKFTFSIKFSRIYLQKHPELAASINENSKIHVKYNGHDYPLYVSSYSRKCDENILDEISVELSEELTITQNKTKQQMDSILGNVNEQINSALKDNNNQDVNDKNFTDLKKLLKDKLSRLTDDTASGLITFLKGLVADKVITARQGAEFGEFVTGLYTGTGAAIDAKGNAEMESLRVRSYLEVMELIINRLSALEGDQILTESDTIETIDDLGDGVYRLTLKEKWEGYFTGQVKGNVLKGIINTLASGSGTYYTSWMLVKDVDTASNQIVVQMYPDDETPAGTNYPPCQLMKIARWGNVTDEMRQSCLYLSSSDNRIMRINRVTKPIIDIGNYGFILGELPDWFYADEQKLPISKDGDAIYVKTIVYQNSVKMNYQGKPEATIVDRGTWVENPEEPYHFEAVNSQTGVYETSDVWYRGCKWRCIRDQPTGAPRYDSMEWFMIEGNPDFSISIEVENGGLLDFDWFAIYGTDLVVTGQIHNQDVTADIRDSDVVWTRRSKDSEGNWRTQDDEAWNALSRRGKTLHLTVEDISYNSSGLPSILEFTATALLRDGVTAEDTISVI